MRNGFEPVDTDQLTGALLRLEQTIHRRGWDQPPDLYVLRRRENQNDRIFHQTLPVPLPTPSGETLLVLAARLQAAVQIGHPALKVFADPETTAVAVSDEVWANDDFPSEQARALDRRPLADIPGSYEARLLAAVDVNANQYLIRRRRGAKPDTHLREPGHRDRFGGRVYDGLAGVVGSFAQLIHPDTTVEPELLPWAGRSHG